MQPLQKIARLEFVTSENQVVDLPTTDNALERFLDGAPKRSENVPTDVVQAVEVFARAMIDNRFWNGYFGDTSDAFFQDRVSDYLDMPNWNNRERIFIVLSVALDNAAKFTKVPSATLEVVAKHAGYKIEWQPEEELYGRRMKQLAPITR